MTNDEVDDEPSAELALGAQAEVTLEVEESDTAIAHRSGDVPVLATPRVLALCEEATVLALGERLDDSLTSVGTHVEIAHLALSRVGETVIAKAELAEVEGRRLVFEVSVAGSGGGVLARGRIQRIVVDRASFLGQ